MKHFVRCLWITPIVAALLFLAVGAVAQGSLSGQTFNLDPAGCGAANATLTGCVIDVGGPQPPLNEYSWGTFNLNGDGTGDIQWENMPMGQLGTSNATWACTATGTFTAGTNTITACTAITVQISGDYLAFYGGGSYSGTVTMVFAYKYQMVNRWTTRWNRYITGGKVTIN